MAAVTGTILAVAGLGLSAAQMVKASKDKQQAQDASKRAAAAIKATTQQNAFEALQAPDVSSLAEQYNLQAQAQSVQAIQGLGAEGAAQITGVEQAARAAGLQTAERQAQINYQRDLAQSGAQQDINLQRYVTETGLEENRLKGAQAQAFAADQARNAAIEGMFGFAGRAVSSGADLAPLHRERRGDRLAREAATSGALGKPENLSAPVQGDLEGFDWMWNNNAGLSPWE